MTLTPEAHAIAARLIRSGSLDPRYMTRAERAILDRLSRHGVVDAFVVAGRIRYFPRQALVDLLSTPTRDPRTRSRRDQASERRSRTWRRR